MFHSQLDMLVSTPTFWDFVFTEVGDSCNESDLSWFLRKAGFPTVVVQDFVGLFVCWMFAELFMVFGSTLT